MQREAREEVLRQNEEAKRRRRKHVPGAKRPSSFSGPGELRKGAL